MTWLQYRYQGALAAGLLAVLAVVLVVTGLHAAQVWHSALAGCAQDGSCASLGSSQLSLGSSLVQGLVVATAAVPLLPGLFWGAPMVAQEAEAGTYQFAWMQSITRRRWLAVRAEWLLLGATVLAGVVSALATWWSGPDTALHADAFQVGRFDVIDIAPVGYAVFAMALGICAGALLRRTIPAIATTLAGFAALRVLTSEVLRPHYITPVTVYYSLAQGFVPSGSYLQVSQGVVGPNGQPPAADPGSLAWQGFPIPAPCRQAFASLGPKGVPSCLTAHGYRGYLTYQPASRFWAFQGIETGIYLVLAAALLGVTFWVVKRWDA
ncbi:MAG: transporter permease [Actinomycetia bacterium]|nr:transporter permease [Actinomycetes bacterium]